MNVYNKKMIQKFGYLQLSKSTSNRRKNKSIKKSLCRGSSTGRTPESWIFWRLEVRENTEMIGGSRSLPPASILFFCSFS